MNKRFFFVVTILLAVLAVAWPRAAFAQERCPDSHSGTITNATAVQTGHLQNGASSACGVTKATPTLQAANVSYEAFTLENRSTTASCVTVNLSATAGSAHSTVYKSSYDPTNPQTNYMGDSGGNAAAGAPLSYGVTIPPLTNFVVVVTEGNAHAGATYAVTIDGCKQVVVTAISPNAGSFQGTTNVTISGSGFLPGATVTIGGNPATNVNVVDGNTITATTPAGTVGAADVVVTNADIATVPTDTSTLAGGFNYVSGLATIISVSSTTNPSVFGQNVFFTTKVSSSMGAANGTVDIFDGATDISGPLMLDGTGSASFPIATLTPGAHSITVQFAGNPNFAAGTSAPLIQTVNLASTTNALSSSLNPSHIGQMVTFTAKVAVTAPGAGVPTGTVSFFDGVNDIGDVAVDGAGTATLSTSALALGDHMISATYNGDGKYDVSTGSITQTVSLFPATTALTSSANPSILNQNVTFTAQVIGGAAGTPTGTADFFDGATPIAGPVALDGTGKAQFSTSTLTAGGHPITAVYSGDATYATSTSPIVNQTVGKSVATATTTSSLNPSKFGQSVTLTCTVTGGTTPTGTAQFFDGATSLGGAAALDGTGKATLALATLAVASHSITCHYSGDAIYASTVSAVLTQVVNLDGTTVTLVSSLNPSNVGQSVTLTATVAATTGSAIPTGTVAFKDGTTTIGTFNVDGTGKATTSTTTLTAGTHSITAVYSGDTNNATSTSAALSQVVNGLTDGGAVDGGASTDGGSAGTDGGSSGGNDAGSSGGGGPGGTGGKDASTEGGVENGDVGGGGGCDCRVTSDGAAGMGGGALTWLGVAAFLVVSRRRRNKR